MTQKSLQTDSDSWSQRCPSAPKVRGPLSACSVGGPVPPCEVGVYSVCVKRSRAGTQHRRGARTTGTSLAVGPEFRSTRRVGVTGLVRCRTDGEGCSCPGGGGPDPEGRTAPGRDDRDKTPLRLFGVPTPEIFVGFSKYLFDDGYFRFVSGTEETKVSCIGLSTKSKSTLVL